MKKAAETAIATAGSSNGEIAFFGGSFTAIDRDYMTELLSAAKPYIDNGFFEGIRISTRPDAIDGEICEILKSYGVTSVELGCQSMDEEVLNANLRGHTPGDVENATLILRRYGFEVGHQMMTGLYMSSPRKDIETAKKLIGLKPDTVRIYPTVVLENTLLCDLYKSGKYRVMSGEETVELCSELLLMFYENNIKVIRTGLHSGGNVEEGYVAGFYHPAFKELCESRIFKKKIISEIENRKIKNGKIKIFVSPPSVSPAAGHGRSNINFLVSKGYIPRIIPDGNSDRYEVKVEEE